MPVNKMLFNYALRSKLLRNVEDIPSLTRNSESPFSVSWGESSTQISVANLANTHLGNVDLLDLKIIEDIRDS